MNGPKALLDGIGRVSTRATQNKRLFLSNPSTALPRIHSRCRFNDTHLRTRALRGNNASRWQSTAASTTTTPEQQLDEQPAVNTRAAASPYRQHARVENASSQGSAETASRYGEVERSSKYNELRTAELYTTLEEKAAKGRLAQTEAIVNILVETRNERPNIRLYSALILANIDSLAGSAAKLSSLLDEMRQEKFTLDTVICHNALKVLAVHPDFALRGQILADMRNQWLSLSEEGWHDVVAGYLREGLFEQALEGLETMENDKVPVAGWLYDMAVYLLCQIEEVSEALRIMQRRVSFGATAGTLQNAWYQLFDQACALLHYDAISFIWGRCVRLLYLNPTTGQCMCVLNAAARAGDVELATDAFRILSERKTVFDSIHYELLIEAYLNAHDMSTAFSLLCVMNSSNLHPDMSAVAPITRYLSQSPSRPPEAFQILQNLAQSRHPPPSLATDAADQGETPERAGPPVVVPIVAMNSLLHATILVSGINPAIEFYKGLRSVCAEGPNLETFHLLLRGCRDGERKDTAMFLVSEMVALGIEPDTLTYDRLILTCVHVARESGDYEDAFRYYGEMTDSNLVPRRGTMQLLIKMCAIRADQRAWSLLAAAEELGYQYQGISEWMTQNWGDTTQSDKVLFPRGHDLYSWAWD